MMSPGFGSRRRSFVGGTKPLLVSSIALLFLPICLSLVQEKTISEMTKHVQSQSKTTPISNTVLCLPPGQVAHGVVFLQKATNTRIEGYANLQSACQDWENYFQTDEYDDVTMNLCRASIVSPTTMIVQWNVTWTNPNVLFLQSLARWNNWTTDYRSYLHLSDQVSKFSYKAVADLFYEAFTTKRLRIPLACIEGTSTFEFSSSSDGKVVSITEDLGLAQDLQQRGTLKNRKCAQDLRLFLETARRTGEAWDDVVATKLPWMSVPGMGALDVEESSDDPIVPVLFLAFSAFVILGFAALAAPELLGQSLLGPPTYIVPPEELNSIY
jgi:hypothetical protein